MHGCRQRVHSVPVYVLDTRDDSTMDLWLVGFPAALVVDESGVILDVRHPLSVKGVIAALNGASAIERYPMSRQEVAAP
jgi:hypothetical protein